MPSLSSSPSILRLCKLRCIIISIPITFVLFFFLILKVQQRGIGELGSVQRSSLSPGETPHTVADLYELSSSQQRPGHNSEWRATTHLESDSYGSIAASQLDGKQRHAIWYGDNNAAVSLSHHRSVLSEAATEDSPSDSSNALQSSSSSETGNKTQTYTQWCEDFHSLSIFTINNKLTCPENKISFCLGLMLAIFFSLLIELFLQKLENDVWNRVTRELINKVFREIAMLGLISYGVQFLESTNLMEELFLAFSPESNHVKISDITHRRVLIFELVHIVLFGLSLFFVLTVVISYFQAKISWKGWERYEKKNRKQALRSAFTKVRRFQNLSLVLKCLSPWSIIEYLSALEVIAYWTCRQQFIETHRLPSDFRYFVYLKDRARRLLVDLSEIGYPLWTLVFMLALCEIIRNLFVKYSSATLEVLFFVFVFIVSSILFCTAVFILVRFSYSSYLRKLKKETPYWKNALSSESSDLAESLMGNIHESQPEQNARQVVEDGRQQEYTPQNTSHQEQGVSADAERNSSTERSPQLEEEASDTQQQILVAQQQNHDMQFGQNVISEGSTSSSSSDGDNLSRDDPLNKIRFPSCPRDRPAAALFDMKRFFLLRSPRLYLILIQLTLFTQCFYLSVLTIHFADIIVGTDTVCENIFLRVLFLLFAYSGSLLVIVLFPFIFAPFIILTSQENLSSMHSVRVTIKEMKKWPNGKDRASEHKPRHHHYFDYQKSGVEEELRLLLAQYQSDHSNIKQGHKSLRQQHSFFLNSPLFFHAKAEEHEQ